MTYITIKGCSSGSKPDIDTQPVGPIVGYDILPLDSRHAHDTHGENRNANYVYVMLPHAGWIYMQSWMLVTG